jgi:hypothetical protein
MRAPKRKLEVGDIVVVSTALTGLREYAVKKIEGNRAITDFRIFNRRIWDGGAVYEYGKRYGSTTNYYWIKPYVPERKEKR